MIIVTTTNTQEGRDRYDNSGFRGQILAAIAFRRLSILGLAVVLTTAESADLPKLTFEPLSLTISKFERGSFGEGTNPFSQPSQSFVSGTQLVVKVTPESALQARLVMSACELRVFRDDRGLDLLEVFEGPQRNPFWEADRRPHDLHRRQSRVPRNYVPLSSYAVCQRGPGDRRRLPILKLLQSCVKDSSPERPSN